MFERFTESARRVVLQAQETAGHLGHGYVGCEHLLLAAAGTDEPASEILRTQGVTPDRVEAEILRTIGRGQTTDPLSGLDRQALASIGIDLDVVRARIEAAFGPDALFHAGERTARQNSCPTWEKGPLAELARRRRRRRARRHATPLAGLGDASIGPSPTPGGHLPFTPRAKKCLQLSRREANAMHDNYIGVQHLTLALLVIPEGTVPLILSALGAPATALRGAILTRYRNAS
jgi:ATP-dependent Clp protease ATP-binding subunit ClpA